MPNELKIEKRQGKLQKNQKKKRKERKGHDNGGALN